MFTWLNKQGVKSDAGFIVQRVDRFVIEYRDEDCKISVDVEAGRTDDGRQCLNISRNAFEKWDGSSVRSPPDEQARLLANFTAALEFQGLAVIAY